MNYYETLGVSPTATPQEIKDCYRRIAMKTHPDRNNGDERLSLRFKQATEAYEILSDAKKREEYDRSQLSNLIEDPLQAAKAVWNKFIDEALEIPTKEMEPT
jgi:DnaJ-class molecular chaperone